MGVPCPLLPPQQLHVGTQHPRTSCSSRQLHWNGDKRHFPSWGLQSRCLVPPILTPFLPPSLSSLFLSSAPLSSNLITCQPVLIFASQSPSWMEGKD